MKRIHTFAMTALGLSALLLSACSKPAVQTQTAAATQAQTQPAAEVQTAASEAKTEAETEGK